MTEFIKAHDEPDGTVFEMAVRAVSESGAKTRASIDLFGRRPGKLTALESINARELTDGPVSEYRVLIKIRDKQGLKEKLKINDAVEALEELL